MKLRVCILAICLALPSLSRAQGEAQSSAPSWAAEIARGFLPHHELRVEDFPVNDKTDPGTAFVIQTFIHPRPHLRVKSGEGIVDLAIDQWLVFSGFDRNLSWRKSAFKDMKGALPYAQAILDLNEIYARQLAALPLSELPQTRSTNIVDASAELESKVKELVDAREKQIATEKDSLGKDTDNGHDAKKVREKAAEIRKRLDATTPSIVPYPQPPSAATSPSP